MTDAVDLIGQVLGRAEPATALLALCGAGFLVMQNRQAKEHRKQLSELQAKIDQLHRDYLAREDAIRAEQRAMEAKVYDLLTRATTALESRRGS